MEFEGARDRWCSGDTGCSMLGVILVLEFHLRIVARSLAVLDAIMDVDVGVDVFTNIIRQGFIHLLVGTVVAALSALWTRRASALVQISFIVAPGSCIEVGAASSGSRVLGALMLTSSVVAGASGVMVAS